MLQRLPFVWLLTSSLTSCIVAPPPSGLHNRSPDPRVAQQPATVACLSDYIETQPQDAEFYSPFSNRKLFPFCP